MLPKASISLNIDGTDWHPPSLSLPHAVHRWVGPVLFKHNHRPSRIFYNIMSMFLAFFSSLSLWCHISPISLSDFRVRCERMKKKTTRKENIILVNDLTVYKYAELELEWITNWSYCFSVPCYFVIASYSQQMQMAHNWMGLVFNGGQTQTQGVMEYTKCDICDGRDTIAISFRVYLIYFLRRSTHTATQNDSTRCVDIGLCLILVWPILFCKFFFLV